VLYPPVKSGHLLIDGATLASVIGKKLSAFSAMQNVDDGTSRTSTNVCIEWRIQSISATPSNLTR
jgi:hypothetical protein